ncbi:D-(-)-3-hydroxybutyrate oligomer hydrolase [Usitatibacter rugosus]|uniref:D-(-)-3-hydroxybutyrate oligomer hydrolase n=1 Tax=Usitatibacter rugosus TaxID=2732067 RepID=A0A6M4H0A1_9PROT|nr:3-hydroxybutyrate oligomer hydrolase family protein [Usitatibacter rugosus]QJR12755.1 D-(-)-3-hydroxybutyrate oligomer hydrolase [Usitatibacter rugosus]
MSSQFTRALLIVAASALAACNNSDSDNAIPPVNTLPDFVKGTVVRNAYDGTSNDLLTAGLGKSGLQGALPAFADAANPTVAELRRQAIYNNYRALVDMTTNGGYGVLYGPNVDSSGAVTPGEGRIGGEEFIAYADDGTGKLNVTVMVQIPNTFSTTNPCIVTAASSGSRGIYGAIATAGEWGLKKGCAVAYTDKGSGNGGHDLAANTVYNLQGQRGNAGTLGVQSIFTAAGTDAERAAFNTAFPNRWAYKHAHSQQNPEKDWGQHTIQAIRFAFYALNEKYGPLNNGERQVIINNDNTIVIASSVSNGAGAAVAALEQDNDNYIDGLAVAEPQIQMNAPTGVTIRRGSTTVASNSKPLYDYFTIANMVQPCAALAPSVANSPLLATNILAPNAANRCTDLANAGIISGTTTADRATSALALLHASGWEADSDLFHASHYALATLSVTYTYATAYSRSGVRDNLCGYSFGGAPVAGVPAVIANNASAQLFGTGNGVPPTSGINILNNNSVGGTALDAVSISPSSNLADYNYDGANCLRTLFTGATPGAIATRAGIEQVKRTGNLRGKPAVIVHGRSDTLIPVNHTSRPYYALNKLSDTGSQLAYYEVTNAQHFDGFLGLAGYDTRLVPLHRYFIQAMDIVYNKLRNNTPIPASQVVRTIPRGGAPGAAPAITAANVPPIAATPAPADAILFANSILAIPE